MNTKKAAIILHRIMTAFCYTLFYFLIAFITFS